MISYSLLLVVFILLTIAVDGTKSKRDFFVKLTMILVTVSIAVKVAELNLI